MPVQCENPSCRKPDNPDQATLCHRCHKPLPVRFGSRFPAGTGSTAGKPTHSFGPWMNCEPKTAGGTQITLHGHIEDILQEGNRTIGQSGKRSFYGQSLLVILAGGFFGFALVGISALVFFLSGGTAAGIGILIIGSILNLVVIKVSHWLLKKIAFTKGVIKKQHVLPTQSFTRILKVHASAPPPGERYEVHLTSSRDMNIRSPQIGDQIELQGLLHGKRIQVIRYRSGKPF